MSVELSVAHRVTLARKLLAGSSRNLRRRGESMPERLLSAGELSSNLFGDSGGDLH